MTSLSNAIGRVLSMLALVAVSLLVAPLAVAQSNLTFDTSSNIRGASYVGPKSVVADWIYKPVGSGGVSATSVGQAIVPTAVGDAAVGVTATASYTASRIGAIARGFARAAGPVGTAFTAWQIYDWIKKSGVYTCAPPDFFCLPSAADVSVPAALGGWCDTILGTGCGRASGQAMCDYYSTTQRYGDRLPRTFVRDATVNKAWSSQATDSGTCKVFKADGVTFLIWGEQTYSKDAVGCPTGSTMSGSGQCVSNTPTLIPATDPQIEKYVADKASSDPAYGPGLMGAARTDQAGNPGIVPPSVMAPPDLPMNISTGTWTSPNTTTSTKNNPDGSTTTTTANVTVIGKTTGTTLGDSNTTFDQTMQITSKTTNPDGSTTTTTTTTVAPGTSTAAPGGAPDNSPRECGSPGKPACKIDETGTPSDAVTPLKAGNDTLTQSQTDAVAKVNDAATATNKDTGWKFSFALPSGCTTIPMYLDVVVDVCKYRPVIHDLMSLAWLAATVFAIIGMVGRALRPD